MSLHPTLPVSTSQSSNNNNNNAQSQPLITTPAFRNFISRVSSSPRHGLSQRRPWPKLIDRTSLSRPDTLAEAYSQIRKNFSYFRVNYLRLIVFALAVALITHPFSFPVLFGLLASWSYLYLFCPADQLLVLFG